jgi:hypothetical protein
VISPVRLRETEVLAAQLAISSAECARSGPRFCFGVRDALRWLIRGGPAPLTGTPSEVPVPCAAIVHELGAAEAAIHPRGTSLGLRRGRRACLDVGAAGHTGATGTRCHERLSRGLLTSDDRAEDPG